MGSYYNNVVFVACCSQTDIGIELESKINYRYIRFSFLYILLTCSLDKHHLSKSVHHIFHMLCCLDEFIWLHYSLRETSIIHETFTVMGCHYLHIHILASLFYFIYLSLAVMENTIIQCSSYLDYHAQYPLVLIKNF